MSDGRRDAIDPAAVKGCGTNDLTPVTRSEDARFVQPKVFCVGYTEADFVGISAYLRYTHQEDFEKTIDQAAEEGLSGAEILISFYAKLCYKSLIVGPNANLTQVRDIKGNIKGLHKTAHGSVFEHVGINFIVTDCSRVYTHEQVRHRVGVAYSQTSGRFCRIDIGGLQVVWDPILDGCEDIAEHILQEVEKGIYLMECRKEMREPPAAFPNAGPEDCFADGGNAIESPAMMWVPSSKLPFTTKKQLTSAFRRFAPNGQTNEMGMTLNIRTLRHTIMMRTARHAEREIRIIFGQVYEIVKAKYPLLFCDAREEIVDGLLEVSGMRMNPYDKLLEDYSVNDLDAEIARREQKAGLSTT